MHQKISKLGYIPLDPNYCEVVIPAMIVNKEIAVMITVKDINNDLISNGSEELSVFVQCVCTMC